MLWIKYLISFYLKAKKIIRKLYWCNLFCPRLYTSIYDTPAYIWHEFHDEKEVGILLDLIKKHRRRKLKWLKSDKIADLLRKLYEEVVVKFPPKEYIKELKIRHQIAMLRYDAAFKGERIKETIADIKEAELNAKKEQQEIEGSSFYKNCANMQKPHNLNIYIDSRKITIFEYLNNLETLNSKNGAK